MKFLLTSIALSAYGAAICLIVIRKIHVIAAAWGTTDVCLPGAPKKKEVDPKKAALEESLHGQAGGSIICFALLVCGGALLMGGTEALVTILLGAVVLFGLPVLVAGGFSTAMNLMGISDLYTVWAGRLLGIGLFVWICGTAVPT